MRAKLNLEARRRISRYYAILSRWLSKQVAVEANCEYILTGSRPETASRGACRQSAHETGAGICSRQLGISPGDR